MKLESDAEVVVAGEVTVKAYGNDGKPLDDQTSILANEADRKAAVPSEDGGINLSANMVVNLGRQVLAYLVGGKDFNTVTPNRDWVISKVSFGGHNETARFTDTTLSPQPALGKYVGGENTILYDGVEQFLPISGVDYPAPFIVRFEVNLGVDHANGRVIKEAGLWTENGTLFARKTFPPINKREGESLTFLWRIRF